MKTLVKFMFLVFTISALLISCDKKDDENTEPENPNVTTGSMTCTVDETDWSAGLAVVATNSGGIVTVTGSDVNSRQCQVIIYNANGTGTYELGNSMTNPSTGRWTEGLGQNDTYSTQLGLGSGTVNITELTATKVVGTFSFDAKNGAGTVVDILSGEFSAVIQ